MIIIRDILPETIFATWDDHAEELLEGARLTILKDEMIARYAPGVITASQVSIEDIWAMLNLEESMAAANNMISIDYVDILKPDV